MLFVGVDRPKLHVRCLVTDGFRPIDGEPVRSPREVDVGADGVT
jgi:hypothetical protein